MHGQQNVKVKVVIFKRIEVERLQDISLQKKKQGYYTNYLRPTFTVRTDLNQLQGCNQFADFPILRNLNLRGFRLT